jgi:hypothetical protein
MDNEIGSISDFYKRQKRGSILCETAYAQGKMIDHSKWQLPRKISLSDVDAVIDNRGWFLLIEFTSCCTMWNELPYGQATLYRNLVKGLKGKAVAVLCRHNVPSNRSICSMNDVWCFSPMTRNVEYKPKRNINNCWVDFVNSLFKKGTDAWINANITNNPDASPDA